MVFFFRLANLDSFVPREVFLTGFGGSEESTTGGLRQMAETLDALMGMMFQFCEKKRGQGEDVQHTIYDQLFSTFESMILPAEGLHHAHFLIFYVCSSKSALCENFLDRLWAKVESPSTPLVLRKSSADYLASFLGKANFVSMK